MREHPSSSRKHCLLCLALRLCMLAAVALAISSNDGTNAFWQEFGWALLLGGPAVWAHWRWCPDRDWLKADRLFQWQGGQLHVAPPPDENRLRGLLCGDSLLWYAVPADDIAALRLTPGYLAIYLKPSLAALDVSFDERETETVRRILAPLAHLFVDEVPK